jgi:membrane protease YdiL (CAAX protease family)
MSSKRELIIFLVLAYVWAWLVFVPLVLLRGPLQWTILATFGPTVAAFITQLVSRGDYRAFRLGPSWPRTGLAVLVGVCLVLLAYVVLPAVVTSDPRKLNWSILASLAVYNYSSFLGGPLGEEPGWRGYALPRLEASLGPLVGSLVLAVLWAAWHIPLFFYPGWTSSTFWTFLLILIGMSFIFSFSTNLSYFSIIPPIAMHVAFNTVSHFLNGLFTRVQPSTRIPFELVMGLTGLATAVVLVLVTKGRLAYPSKAPSTGPLQQQRDIASGAVNVLPRL